jgi:predicted SprT family Zn-dependent metalloprotease
MTERTGGEPRTRAGLVERARSYARRVDLNLDLEAVSWEVSERARRRAGACSWDGETATIRLTWDAYREYGWERFAGTVRHELIHAWEFQAFGSAGHGERFRRQAARLDAPVDCEQFAAARVHVHCTRPGCDWTLRRYKASKTVREPEQYRCGDCGARYEVVHRESGLSWRTAAGYREARETLGDRW